MAEDLWSIHLSLCIGIHNADELSLAFSKSSSSERVSQCKWEGGSEGSEREGSEREGSEGGREGSKGGRNTYFSN